MIGFIRKHSVWFWVTVVILGWVTLCLVPKEHPVHRFFSGGGWTVSTSGR